jgi:hypothetical protein
MVVSAEPLPLGSRVRIHDLVSGSVIASFDTGIVVERAVIGDDAIYFTGRVESADAGIWMFDLTSSRMVELIQPSPSSEDAIRPAVLVSATAQTVGASLCTPSGCSTDIARPGTGEAFRIEAPGGLFLLTDEFAVLIDGRALRALAFDGAGVWSEVFDGQIYDGYAIGDGLQLRVSWQEIHDGVATYHIGTMSDEGHLDETVVLEGPDADLRVHGAMSVPTYAVLMPGLLMGDALEEGYVRLLDVASGQLLPQEIQLVDG